MPSVAKPLQFLFSHREKCLSLLARWKAVFETEFIPPLHGIGGLKNKSHNPTIDAKV